MSHSIVSWRALAAVAALLSGCSLMPVHERPEAPVAAVFPGEPPDPPPGSAADRGWRQVFADPRLVRLVEMALENNRDLRVAVLNIEQARAQYRIQRAAQLPGVDGGASRSVQRLPADLSATGAASISRSSEVDVGISSFELDFFGRVRSLKEQALESYLATEEARRATHIALVGQVATGYFTLAADADRLALARQTLESESASYELSRRKLAIGTISALTLSQLRSSVETARADVARYQSQVEQDANLLTLLVGAAVPDTLRPDGLVEAGTLAVDLPAGLPSDLLARRPDILQAEHTLRSADASIGAARAAFFPRITLTGSFGSASTGLDGLFKAGSGAWSFAPSISVPIFDGGANRARLDGARADRAIGVARYEEAIQTAFREVADALSRRRHLAEQLDAQQALVEATGNSLRLSRARFSGGVDSYLDVLDSQRSFYAARQNLISTRLTRETNLVTLYQVLGGGWT